jgi:hypothetical protein
LGEVAQCTDIALHNFVGHMCRRRAFC